MDWTKEFNESALLRFLQVDEKVIEPNAYAVDDDGKEVTGVVWDDDRQGYTKDGRGLHSMPFEYVEKRLSMDSNDFKAILMREYKASTATDLNIFKTRLKDRISIFRANVVNRPENDLTIQVYDNFLTWLETASENDLQDTSSVKRLDNEIFSIEIAIKISAYNEANHVFDRMDLPDLYLALNSPETAHKAIRVKQNKNLYIFGLIRKACELAGVKSSDDRVKKLFEQKKIIDANQLGFNFSYYTKKNLARVVEL